MDNDGSRLLKFTGEEGHAAVLLGVTITAYRWYYSLPNEARLAISNLRFKPDGVGVYSLGENINEAFASRPIPITQPERRFSTKGWIRQDGTIESFKTFKHGDMGHIIVLFYMFDKGIMREWRKPYYVSDKGRLCFKRGPGMWSGMVPARIGQFSYEDGGASAEMYTTQERYEHDRAHFYRCVVRLQNRKHQETMQKFVGGTYSKKGN